MEKCKFCQAELEDGVTLCPSCGKDNAEMTEETAAPEQTTPEAETVENAEEVPAEETPAEQTEEAPAEETASEETPAEPAAEEKKATPGKIALAVAAIVVLLAVLAALIVSGMGGEKQAAVPEAGETAAVEETVPATIPADGEKGTVTEKGTYSVSDEEAIANGDVVVATIEGKELTNTQLQVYYWMEVQSFLSQYASYASYMGLDYTKPLDTQTSMEGEGVTWQHFFLQSALYNWQRIQGMALEAEKANLTISAEDQAYLDSIPAAMEQQAANYGVTLDEFLLRNIGAGAEMDDFIAYQIDYHQGSLYYDAEAAKLVPTEQEIEDFFAEKEEGYAANGLTKDTMLIDVRHILLTPESAAGDGTYTDKEWKVCEEAAQKILDTWLAGDKTEESFAALANEHSTDPGSNTNGGLYEGVYEGQMVPTFNDWCFDASRKFGDTDLVKTDYGYHVMFFVGSEPQWKQVAESDWINTKINDLFASMTEKYPLEVSYDKICLAEVSMS